MPEVAVGYDEDSGNTTVIVGASGSGGSTYQGTSVSNIAGAGQTVTTSSFSSPYSSSSSSNKKSSNSSLPTASIEKSVAVGVTDDGKINVSKDSSSDISGAKIGIIEKDDEGYIQTDINAEQLRSYQNINKVPTSIEDIKKMEGVTIKKVTEGKKEEIKTKSYFNALKDRIEKYSKENTVEKARNDLFLTSIGLGIIPAGKNAFKNAPRLWNEIWRPAGNMLKYPQYNPFDVQPYSTKELEEIERKNIEKNKGSIGWGASTFDTSEQIRQAQEQSLEMQLKEQQSLIQETEKFEKRKKELEQSGAVAIYTDEQGNKQEIWEYMNPRVQEEKSVIIQKEAELINKNLDEMEKSIESKEKNIEEYNEDWNKKLLELINIAETTQKKEDIENYNLAYQDYIKGFDTLKEDYTSKFEDYKKYLDSSNKKIETLQKPIFEGYNYYTSEIEIAKKELKTGLREKGITTIEKDGNIDFITRDFAPIGVRKINEGKKVEVIGMTALNVGAEAFTLGLISGGSGAGNNIIKGLSGAGKMTTNFLKIKPLVLTTKQLLMGAGILTAGGMAYSSYSTGKIGAKYGLEKEFRVMGITNFLAEAGGFTAGELIGTNLYISSIKGKVAKNPSQYIKSISGKKGVINKISGKQITDSNQFSLIKTRITELDINFDTSTLINSKRLTSDKTIGFGRGASITNSKGKQILSYFEMLEGKDGKSIIKIISPDKNKYGIKTFFTSNKKLGNNLNIAYNGFSFNQYDIVTAIKSGSTKFSKLFPEFTKSIITPNIQSTIGYGEYKFSLFSQKGLSNFLKSGKAVSNKNWKNAFEYEFGLSRQNTLTGKEIQRNIIPTMSNDLIEINLKGIPLTSKAFSTISKEVRLGAKYLPSKELSYIQENRIKQFLESQKEMWINKKGTTRIMELQQIENKQINILDDLSGKYKISPTQQNTAISKILWKEQLNREFSTLRTRSIAPQILFSSLIVSGKKSIDNYINLNNYKIDSLSKGSIKTGLSLKSPQKVIYNEILSSKQAITPIQQTNLINIPIIPITPIIPQPQIPSIPIIPFIPPKQIYGGGIKRKGRYVKKQQVYGYMADFTSRVLGIKKKVSKSQALKMIDKTYSGLELRPLLSFSDTNKIYQGLRI